MEFTNPAALWLLLVLPLLWLRRALPRIRVPVAALHLWMSATPHQVTAAPRRPRVDPLVLLRTAAVASLILALAGPTMPLPGRRVALIVDLSASMDARDGAGQRIDAARERALELLRAMPMLTRVELIGARSIPERFGVYAVSEPGLRQALAGLRTTPEEADLDAAIRRAADGTDHTFVLTDGAAPGPDQRRLTWVQVGRPSDNVAVVNLAYTRDPERRSELRILVSLWNFGATPAERELVVTDGTGAALREQVAIGSRERRTVVRTMPNAGGRLTAAIDGADALPADDSRSITIPAAFTRRVRLENAGAFLEHAVRALPDVAIVDDDADVVVCGLCGALPPGRGGVLRTPPTPATPATTEPLVRTAVAHPIGTSVSLDGLLVAPIADGDPATATVIAEAGGAAVIVASDLNERRVVELRMDLSKGTLPLAPAFPILVANAIDWLAPSPDQRIQGGIPPAESDLRSPTVTPPVAAAAPALRAPASDVTRLWLSVAMMLISAEWWYSRRRSHARRPRGFAALSRAGVAVMLALGVAGLELPGGIAPIAGFVVLDRSASMGRGARGLEHLAALAGARRDDDRLGVVVFGAAPAVERRLGTEVALPAITSTVEPGGTNIEAALRIARTTMPPQGSRRIVLLSDGQQTAGDALREARRAFLEGIRIDVALPTWVSAEGRAMNVTRVTAPPWVRAGEPFELTAIVEGKAGARGDLVLRRDGASSTAVPVTIPRSGMTTVGFTDRQAAAGMYVYRVHVSLPADDLGVGGDDLSAGTGAVVVVSGDPHVLHVGGAPDVDGVLVQAGFRVHAVAPGSLPATAAALASYDAIVLDDVAGDQLSDAQGTAVTAYVEQSGGGLLILGSARSLDSGFGGSTALTALAPIDFRPRAGQRTPGASLVIVFDKSGSMADLVDGAPKIEYARQAVERVLEVVSDADLVGVIAFDSTALPVVPLEAGHSATSVKARLRATAAGGATAIGPAMELARSWLRSAPASVTARRHILVVSDGRTSAADAARALEVAAEPGIQVSAVAVDAVSDRELLAAMASRSGGRAYFPSDTRELPRLLAREASRVAGGRVVEEPFRVRIAPHAVTTGLDDASGPMMRGYVVGAVKPRSEAALVSHLGDPILATTRRGLGRVGVYTADLRSPWSEGLRSWHGFPTLLAQTVRWITRRTRADGLFTSIQSTDAGLHVVVETDDATQREARVLVRRPASSVVENVVLEPTLPGRFEGQVGAAVPGPYLLSIAAGPASSEAALVRGYYWTPERELASSGMDLPLLSAIARTTGGRVLDDDMTMFSGPRDRMWRPATTWLAGAALAALLAELLAPACGGLIQWLRRRPRPFLTSVETT